MDAGTQKRRILVVFALGILFPTFFLTWLSSIAVRNDGAQIARIAREEARGVARDYARELQTEIRRLEAAARAEIDLSLLESERTAWAREQLDGQLRRATAAHPIVAGYFVVDENRNKIVPAVSTPWVRARPGQPWTEGLDGESYSLEAMMNGAGDGGASLQDTIRAFEERRASELALERAERVEVRDEDPARAVSLYEEIIETTEDPRTRARALAKLGRSLWRLDRLDEAIACYAELGSLPREHFEKRQPLRVLGRVQEAWLLTKAGRPIAALDRLADLAHDLELGTYELVRGQHEYFAERCRTLFAATIAEARTGERSNDERARIEAAASRLVRVDARSRETAERIAFSLRVDRQVLRYLGNHLDDSALPAEGYTHLSRLGDEPLLVHYAIQPLGAPGGQTGGRVLVGFIVDLDWIASDVAPAVGGELLASIGEDAPAIGIALLDQPGREAARVGSDFDASDDLAVTEELDATLPFWKVRVSHDGAELRRESRWRATLYLGIVATAVAAILVGAFSAFRAVTTSLQLARLKNDFVSAVTHELRTPLTSIRMFAEMLAMGRVRNEEKKLEYFRIIANESERLGTLIDNILDFARLEQGRGDYNFEVLEPVAFLERALEIFRFHVENKGFSVDAELPPQGQLRDVRVDRGTMTRAVLNLLGNAMKYSRDRKEVKVRLYASSAGGVAVSIQDFGIGIAVDERERIFEKFYRSGSELTREVPGTGLGLAIVQQIVEAHGGLIRVESVIGEGSTFTIELPPTATSSASGETGSTG